MEIAKIVRCRNCVFYKNGVCIRKVKAGGAKAVDQVSANFFCAAGKEKPETQKRNGGAVVARSLVPCIESGKIAEWYHGMRTVKGLDWYCIQVGMYDIRSDKPAWFMFDGNVPGTALDELLCNRDVCEVILQGVFESAPVEMVVDLDVWVRLGEDWDTMDRLEQRLVKAGLAKPGKTEA